MNVEAQIKKVAAKKSKQVDKALRATMLRMTGIVIQGTPVDTGAAKANWLAATGSPNLQYDIEDKQPGRANVELPVLDGNTVLYFTNSLPYIRRLEFGWSDKGSGMVRRAIAAYDRIADEEFKRYVK